MMKLKEIYHIAKGRKAEESSLDKGLRYIQIDDLRNDNQIKFAFPSPKNILCNTGDILIAWDGANAGTVGYGLSGVIGSTLAKLSPKKTGIFPAYAGRFLQSKFKYLRDNCTGSTIPHISRPILENILIPLPPLETQKKIAAILEAADAYRQKTKALIEKYDELAKSLFLEMFGDPVKNEKGWEILKFSEVGKLDRGKSQHRPRNAPILLGGKHPLIQTGDVANSNGYIKEFKSTYSEAGLAQSKIWPKGTLCITIAANIAKTGILTFDACFPDSVVGFIPNEKTNNEFAQVWMSFLQKIIENSAPESAQKNINLAILRDLDIPNPPIYLQNQFAQHVQAIEAQKEQGQKVLEKSEELFKSLLQRAFNGTLLK